ncbi:MAG TPA: alpha/beta hydrolase [Puia sp.]|nr:alpha/beta hydrolase [Puia sp.]
MKKILHKIFSKSEKNIPNANEILIWPHETSDTSKEKSVRKIGLQVISNIHHPSIIPYLPSPQTATGAALIIAPGGSHRELWIEHEGYNVAQWFSEHGISSFVLKYRLAKEFGSPYSMLKHSLADMQQAIRLVRHHSKEWNIDPLHIGVMGFSAGGELAGLAAENFDEGNKNAEDKILHESSRPDFQALIYPSDAKKFKPSKNSPPLFLLAGENDRAIAKNITSMHSLYKEAGISTELLIYENEDHGFGIQKNNSASISKWPEVFMKWLLANSFI